MIRCRPAPARLFFLLLCAVLLTMPLEVIAEESSSGGEAAEALEMIASRMKSLSGSLNQMPELPRLNQTLMIPLAGRTEPGSKTFQEETVPDHRLLEKEVKE